MRGPNFCLDDVVNFQGTLLGFGEVIEFLKLLKPIIQNTS
jgi:hypothetical protein